MQLIATNAGAIGDGTHLNTKAIQHCIDQVSAEGGGKVIIPAGTFLTGMIEMRSRVHLHLHAGCTLLASPDIGDHSKRIFPTGFYDNPGLSEIDRFHLLVAENCEDIAITGDGVIDGNGTSWYDCDADNPWPLGYEDEERMAPMVEIYECTRVRIEDVRMRNVGFWSLHLHESDHVRVRGVSIQNPEHAPNADGIDITGCRNVSISDCDIDTSDDCIVIKTFPNGRSSENIHVRGCKVRSRCSALKLGTVESYQDMRNILFSDCIVKDSHRPIALYTQAGGHIADVSFRNIVADTNVPLMFPRPIHIEASGRRCMDGPVGSIRRVTIDGFTCHTQGRCMVTAADGAVVDEIRLSNVHLVYHNLEDPVICAEDIGGDQFCSDNPWARTQRGAFVLENVNGIDLDRVRVSWPDYPPHKDWVEKVKYANGSQKAYSSADWETPGCYPEYETILARYSEISGGVRTI